MKEVASGCEHEESTPNRNEDLPIACVLTALTHEQRERERVLLEEHVASVRAIEERDDGYSFRYAPDAAHFVHMAELVTLEHRCCPFLDFELEWARGDSAPWLHVRGGARVKEFVKETFAPRSAM